MTAVPRDETPNLIATVVILLAVLVFAILAIQTTGPAGVTTCRRLLRESATAFDTVAALTVRPGRIVLGGQAASCGEILQRADRR